MKAHLMKDRSGKLSSLIIGFIITTILIVSYRMIVYPDISGFPTLSSGNYYATISWRNEKEKKSFNRFLLSVDGSSAFITPAGIDQLNIIASGSATIQENIPLQFSVLGKSLQFTGRGSDRYFKGSIYSTLGRQVGSWSIQPFKVLSISAAEQDLWQFEVHREIAQLKSDLNFGSTFNDEGLTGRQFLFIPELSIDFLPQSMQLYLVLKSDDILPLPTVVLEVDEGNHQYHAVGAALEEGRNISHIHEALVVINGTKNESSLFVFSREKIKFKPEVKPELLEQFINSLKESE
jgi:hypothetical protein